MKQPASLILELWGHCQKKEIERVQNYSFSPTRTCYAIEAIASSFSKKPSPPDFLSGMPFRQQMKSVISQDTSDIFWEMRKADLIPERMMQAIVRKKQIANDLALDKES